MALYKFTTLDGFLDADCNLFVVIDGKAIPMDKAEFTFQLQFLPIDSLRKPGLFRVVKTEQVRASRKTAAPKKLALVR